MFLQLRTELILELNKFPPPGGGYFHTWLVGDARRNF